MLGALLLVFTSLVQASDFCVTTWNIHGGKNISKIQNEFQNRLNNCGIWALQETGEDFADIIGEENQRLVHQADSNAIITFYPVADSGVMDLPPNGERRAIWADVGISQEEVIRIYTFHLSYKYKGNPFIGKRRAQEISGVLEHAKQSPYPVVLAGDFNSLGWFLGGFTGEPAIKLVKSEGYQDAHQGKSSRTHTWAGHIDWIFSKFLEILHADFGEKAGSDHKWVRSEFHVPFTSP